MDSTRTDRRIVLPIVAIAVGAPPVEQVLNHWDGDYECVSACSPLRGLAGMRPPSRMGLADTAYIVANQLPRSVRRNITEKTAGWRRVAASKEGARMGRRQVSGYHVLASFRSALEAFEESNRTNSGLRVLSYPILHYSAISEASRVDEGSVWQFAHQDDCPSEEEASRIDAELDLADLVIVPSSDCSDSLRSAGFSESKIAIVPYGVNRDVFWSSDCERDIDVLFVGQLTQRKGIGDIVQMCERSDLSVTLVGPDPLGIASLLPRGQISYLGRLSHQDVALLMRRAKVLVLPSRAEGMPLTMLEAAASGCVPVVTPAASAGFVLSGSNGFVIEPGAIDSLQKSVSLLLEDRSRWSKMSEAAVSLAANMTWQNFAAGVRFEIEKRVVDEQA